MSAWLLVGVLGCGVGPTSLATVPEPVPPPPVAPAPSPPPEPHMETPPPPPPIADDSADRAKQWANEHVAGEFSVTRLGRQTGYPAYVVRVGAPGKPPQREIPIVVVLEKVWTGPSGWASFVEQEGIADPVKTAAAWLALKKGEPQEPFGSVRLYKRQPAPDPRWAGDRLSLIYAGNRSQPMIVELRISPQGTVEVTSERPWVAPPR